MTATARAASNDDCPGPAGGMFSCVSFYARPNAPYRFQVAGYDTEQGAVAIRATAVAKKCLAPTAACKTALSCCSGRCAAPPGSKKKLCQ